MTFYARDVQRFHTKFGLETPPTFVFLPDELFRFRVGFFHEELKEYEDAVASKDLGTALDSLIDLVYIICGCALLHGINVEAFDEMIESTEPLHVYPLFESDEAPKLFGPDFLSPENTEMLVELMRGNIDTYIIAHDNQNEQGIKQALTDFYLNCLFGASDMGTSEECWNELWTDVQRANMSKVRAEKASDSKRGSQWDVIKPPGWQAPRTDEILAKYKRSSKSG